MKDIQVIITMRAEEKLRKEIGDYFSLIKRNPLFAAIEGFKVDPLSGENKIIPMGDFFYACTSWVGYDKIFAHFHDKYVEQESAEFMLKVDQIKEDIDYLLKPING